MNYLNELKKLEILHEDNDQYIEIIELKKMSIYYIKVKNRTIFIFF